MSDAAFDAEWLRLREPVDHRSRARGLVNELRREGTSRGWTQLVDLGTGTGSNVRYVTERIPWARTWTVVDRDADLLERVVAPSASHTIHRVQADLAGEGLEWVRDCQVVTASALLDLVSEAWLRELRDRSVAANAAVYVTLSYDGSVRWLAGGAGAFGSPAGGRDAMVDGEGSAVDGAESVDPGDAVVDGTDALVLDAVNEHQRADKGLGVALGPAAARTAESLFRQVGWEVRTEPSAWVVRGSADAAFLERLVEGWVEAAVEVRPGHESRIRAWGERRVRDVVTGAVTLRVGHLDLLAVPPGSAPGPPPDPP